MPNGFRNRGRVILSAALAALPASIAGAQPVTAEWTPSGTGSSQWIDAARWSTNPNFPNNGTPAGTTYNAVVAPPALPGSLYTITVNQNITVDSLLVNHLDTKISLSSGRTFKAVNGISLLNGKFEMDRATLLDTRVSGPGTVRIGGNSTDTSVPNLNNVTFAGTVATLPATSDTRVVVANNLTLDNATIDLVSAVNFDTVRRLRFAGTNTLGGTGTIEFNGLSGVGSSLNHSYIDIVTVGSLTVAPGITIRTGTASGNVNDSNGTFFNQGTISAQTSGEVLDVGTPVNSGLLESKNGGTLNIHGEWSDAGGSIAVNNGTLSIGGTDRLAALGTVSRTGGIVQYSGTLNNTGKTLDLSTTPAGKLDFTSGAIVNGGTLTLSDTSKGPVIVRPMYSSKFTPSAGSTTFNGVIVDADVTVEGAILTAINGLTLAAGRTISLSSSASANASLGISSSGTLGGSGTVRFDGTDIGGVLTASNSTIGPSITVRTGTQGGTVRFLNNQGTVAAQTAGHRLLVNTANGFAWTNTGVLRADAGVLDIAGKTTTAGLGTLAQSGTGTLNLSAEVTNTGATFDTANYPAFGFNGIIVNGTVQATAAPLTVASPIAVPGGTTDGTGELRNVTLRGNVHVAPGADLRIDGNFTPDNATVRFFGGDSSAHFANTGTISGTGEFTFENTGSSSFSVGGRQLPSSLTFRTRTGATGPGTVTITNHATSAATFSSEVAGGSMTVLGDKSSSLTKFINNGTLRALNGGALTLDNVTNQGTVTVGNGSTLTVTPLFTSTGTINGGGTILGNLASAGTIAPGQSPGNLTVNGNLVLSDSSVLDIEIGGTAPGSGYDLLDVNGNLTLNGTLRLTLVNGFTPTSADVFDFLDFAAASGSFDSVILPTLPAGVEWDAQTLAAGGPAGDPEPTGLAITATAAAGLLRRRPRRTCRRR